MMPSREPEVGRRLEAPSEFLRAAEGSRLEEARRVWSNFDADEKTLSSQPATGRRRQRASRDLSKRMAPSSRRKPATSVPPLHLAARLLLLLLAVQQGPGLRQVAGEARAEERLEQQATGEFRNSSRRAPLQFSRRNKCPFQNCCPLSRLKFKSRRAQQVAVVESTIRRKAKLVTLCPFVAAEGYSTFKGSPLWLQQVSPRGGCKKISGATNFAPLEF